MPPDLLAPIVRFLGVPACRSFRALARFVPQGLRNIDVAHTFQVCPDVDDGLDHAMLDGATHVVAFLWWEVLQVEAVKQ